MINVPLAAIFAADLVGHGRVKADRRVLPSATLLEQIVARPTGVTNKRRLAGPALRGRERKQLLRVAE
jgi:hypothetical protein